MSNKMETIMPNFTKWKMSDISGKRTENSITFNPDRAEPGEDVYVTIPKLNANTCIVPNTLYLTAEFKNKNAKSWFLNNVGKLLVKGLMVKVGGEKAYDNVEEGIYRVYEDLWKSEKQRKNMIYNGIANENTRKLMSKDDSADKTDASDALMFKILGSRISIKLGQILNDHGVYAPNKMVSDITYAVRLPKADEIIVAQSGQKIAGYSLESIKLEYETIESPELADLTIIEYEKGRSLVYEHVSLFNNTEWGKDSTLINLTINVPRKSMKAIVLLFKEKGDVTDSEKYVYPNITDVKITVEGIPNYVYNQGMKKDKLFKEARRLFLNRKRDVMEIDDFYSKHFALVVDMRTFNDGDVVKSGKKLINAQSGILLEITKEATTKDLLCHSFVVSDGMVHFTNKTLQSIS